MFQIGADNTVAHRFLFTSHCLLCSVLVELVECACEVKNIYISLNNLLFAHAYNLFNLIPCFGLISGAGNGLNRLVASRSVCLDALGVICEAFMGI